MALKIEVRAGMADGRTLSEFARTIQRRMKYLNESAYAAVNAMAVNALVSVRAVTKVARPGRTKAAVTPRPDLRYSFYTESAKKRPCLRIAGSGHRLGRGAMGRERFADMKGLPAREGKVYAFADTARGADYVIAAPTKAAAAARAKRILASKIMRYAGLAKRAVTTLIARSGGSLAGAAGADVARVARRETAVRRTVRESKGGGTYSMTARDNLDYSIAAIRGGEAAVQAALRKAVNGACGLIRKRCDGLLLPGEIPTPFPEVRQKK